MRTYFLINLRHQVFSAYQIVFSVLMPVFMFNIFAQMNSDTMGYKLASGANVSAIILIQMAFYSAVLAASMSGSMVSHDIETHFTRTLFLAGVTETKLIVLRFLTSVCVSIIPTTVLYALGAATTSRMPLKWWVITYVAIILISAFFSGYGQFVGSVLPDNSAGSIASGSIVLAAFISDIFIPLTGSMLKIAHFMPLFGLKSLLLWHILDGKSPGGESLNLTSVLANVSVWIVVLVTLSVIAVKLARRR
ncbi:hypothetical protein [Alloscardovia sp. HMSC034E08]|uniref:hypothetical protein n=1 Tax=Alloscardovia sp. HMSC034E08 TaxID=1739413 RepID=UPI0008B59711|nr:hypothetical protein [Alloscardovia sp. HMSC034E08]OFQ96964.1 hypothetical protein HMPREF2909_01030 [Alloscardovia sp. HMSC034E08]